MTNKFFYDDKGNKIDSTKDFINYYEKYYFINQENSNLAGVLQTCKTIENHIEKILEDGIENPLDVYHILIWKMGKVKHKEAEKDQSNSNDNPFNNHYYSGCDEEKLIIKNYLSEIDITDLANDINTNIDTLSQENPKEIIKELSNILNKASIKGIGTVYLITLLYFITKGKYPIYDKYASIALDNIINNNKPHFNRLKCKRTPLPRYTVPPSRNENIEDFLENNYFYTEQYKDNPLSPKSYMDKLHYLFSDDEDIDNFEVSRKIDRALWVYGHGYDASGNC